MELKRQINLKQALTSKSFFLFGPRSTGKSYWIRKSFGAETLVVNLLNSDTFLRLAEAPHILREMITQAKTKQVVIDEVQKFPLLLDEVQNLIEEKGVRFLLTGSSARKLKRENANMLGGRAGILKMCPLSFSEIPEFDLPRFLRYGGLPRVYQSQDPVLELDAYVSAYLEQEIKAESWVRNLIPFSRFLKAASLTNGELVNFANISSDTGIPASSVREYYSILEDTLLGYVLEPWLESKKRKAIQTGKFYLFDPGVCHQIAGTTTLDRQSNSWGRAFEQFIGMELRAYMSYRQKRRRLCFWRSVNKQEVDFIIDNELAIEVKAKKRVTPRDMRGLRALMEEKIVKQNYLVSDDELERKTDDGIILLHWKSFLKQLWEGELF